MALATGFLLYCVSAATAAQRHALLVGVTEYAHLPKDKWLLGPGNDVALLQELLTTRFHFDPGQMTILAGWPGEAHLRPTRTNIAHAFKRLAEVAGAEDQVVIFLAGHGSQQPAIADPNEPDGLDEIFLPADVIGWHEASARVENAIVDDELRDWLTAILNKGAFVWIIVDACHSGTITRGAPLEYERDRHIPATVLVPPEVLATATQRIVLHRHIREVTPVSPGVLGLSATLGGFVATVAAQPNELTPERLLPSLSRSVHGLFTYTLVQVLQQSVTPLTYRELVERLAASYRSQGYLTPTPLIEGGGKDKEVLGNQEWSERPRMLLGDRDLTGKQVLQAGHVHGLRPGAVLAVYPPAGAKGADRPVGHVRVIQTEALTSMVATVAFGDVPAPAADTLERGSRCQVVFVDYGELRMKVAAQTQAALSAEAEAVISTHQPGTGPRIIDEALVALDGRPGSLITYVTNAAEAEWYVRVVQEQVYLIPAAGWNTAQNHGTEGQVTQVVAPSQFALGAVTEAATLGHRLQSALTRIARVHHLLRLTTEASAVSDMAGKVDVHVELLRLKGTGDQDGIIERYDTGGRILHGGNVIAFRITNPTVHTIDVTLLLINSGYGIRTLFPLPGAEYDQRLGPQQQIRTPLFRIVEPFGPEQLVIIAIKADAGRADFSYLEQLTLEQVVRNASYRPAMASPLGKLLESMLYGQGQVRGVSKITLNTYVVRLLTWSTRRAAE